jgi:hypothetical protein
VDLKAVLDDMEKEKFLTPPGLELRFIGRPACSQSLYRLRYRGSSAYLDLRETGWGGTDRIKLTQNREQRWALVNMLNSHWVP